MSLMLNVELLGMQEVRRPYVPAYTSGQWLLMTRNGKSSHWCAVIWQAMRPSLLPVVDRWETSLTFSRMRRVTLQSLLKCSATTFLSDDWMGIGMRMCILLTLSFFGKYIPLERCCSRAVVLGRPFSLNASAVHTDQFAYCEKPHLGYFWNTQVLVGIWRHSVLGWRASMEVNCNNWVPAHAWPTLCP